MAIKTDGTLWGWGENNNAQLGLGNIINRSSPVQVGALTNWLFVACGVYCSVAIKTDNTFWAWGNNTNGRLGLNDTTNRSSPVQVGSLTNWASIGRFNATPMAVKTDGTLWAWGQNNKGQIGLSNTTAYSSPKQIGALTTWYKVEGTTTSGSMFAIKTDGTLWAWGANSQRQLGLGNTTYYSSPKQVGVLTTWLKTAAGRYSVFALKTP
jgi:alpha-tubulin suppressor-like RCC1 family protein